MKESFKDWKEPVFDKEGWAYPGEVQKNMKRFSYGWRCQHSEGLKLGKNVDVGCFTYMNAKYGIEISNNVQIGSHCSIYSDNTENDTRGPVKIGKNCLIGSFCLILPNAVIPSNTKIRAYSIVKGEL